jgi:hypothetical protein
VAHQAAEFLTVRDRQSESLAGPAALRQIRPVLPDEQTTPEQFEIYRRMTPEQRLALAEQLYWTARELKAAGLRSQHPDWTEDEVAREVTPHFPPCPNLNFHCGSSAP